MNARFIAEFDAAVNEGRLHPRGSFDWPRDLFLKMRETFQLAYSHDKSKLFVGTVPQVQAACRWLTAEGLSVGSDEASVTKSHAPVSCAACRDMTYRIGDLPQADSPCQGCGEPLQFLCESDHPGRSCSWEMAS